MTFVRMAYFPKGGAEHYAALAAELADVATPSARLVFLAGPRDDGWQVVQAWQDRESMDAFNAACLLPALARLGARGFPEPPVVHDFVATDSAFSPSEP